MRKVYLLAAMALLVANAWAQQRSYFEAPRLFTEANTRFPQLVSSGDFAVAAYQRISQAGADRGTIDVVAQTTRGGLEWSEPFVVASGIRYEGASVPPVYSIAMDDRGEILLVTVDYEPVTGQEASTTVRIAHSSDEGRSFTDVHAVRGDVSLVSPRAFAAGGGGWLLTMERFDEPSNRIVYSFARDAGTWDELRAIPADILQTGTQSDVAHLRVGTRNVLVFVGENIVPPAVEPGQPDIGDTPQLYAIHTDDRGQTWSATNPATGEAYPEVAGTPTVGPVDVVALAEAGLVIPYTHLRVLSSGLPGAGALTYQDLVMRRPAVAQRGDRRLLTFEAGLRLATDSTRQVAVAGIDRNGNVDGEIEILSAPSLRRTDARMPFNQPTPALIDTAAYVVAYQDPARGGRVVLYERSNGRWQENSPPISLGVATYPAAGVISGRLHLFWHRRTAHQAGLPTRIVYLEPDQRALPPVVSGENFELGRRSRSSVPRFSWSPQEDASGIAGYSYIWTRDPQAPVPALEEPSTATTASFTADDDGEWYLRIRAVDRSGNWSEPETAEFFRDTTPPGRVTFQRPVLDEEGFLASNTFTLRWNPPDDDIIGGYFVDFVYIDDERAEIDPNDLPVISPPHRDLRQAEEISRRNYDDGLYALAVTAVDSVGNIGEPAVLFLRMNKYIPVTEIYTVAAVPDPLGRYSLNILGRGFTANGIVERVIVDRDRRAPYDYVFERGAPGFRVFGDRSMSGPLLDNLESGEYYIGLYHSERGIEFSGVRLTIERNGTVKFGDFTVIAGPDFAMRPVIRMIDGTTAIVWVVIALMLAITVFSSSRLVVVAREGVQLRFEARALIAGRPGLTAEREQRIQQMRKRGIGLRFKFAFFVVVLVMAVVGMVSVGLGTATLNTQRLVLLRGLKDRVDVLMESMVSGAEQPLQDPDVNTLDLDALPAGVRAMDEALYATVTGPKSTIQTDHLPEGFSYVWGTNDPRLRAPGAPSTEARDELLASRSAHGVERATIPPDSPLDLGRTRLDDPISEKIETLAILVDRIAGDRLNAIVRERELTFALSNDLRLEVNAMIARGEDPAGLEEDRQRAQLTLASLNRQISAAVEQVTVDALALIRYAEHRAILEAGQEADTDGRARRERLHAAIARANYEIPDSMQQIEADITRAYAELADSTAFSELLNSRVKTFPIFDPADYDQQVTDFLFYQIVVDPDISIFPFDREAIERMDEADLEGLSYFRGTVRLGVATDLILEQIDQAQADIIRITVLIALAAIGAGVAGALILATIVVIPINKLVKGVEFIRRTQDKSTLKDHAITLNSRDELYRLADSINTMTVALAAAAEAEKDLIVTSDLQKKFIPLTEVADQGKTRKLTMAHLDTAGAEFHGYYEGADALSGDYFTFEWIDRPPEQGGKLFALIKCDVSGHGVNAAFIMVEVATIFLNRVRDWRESAKQPKLADLVNTINDLLVERGFESMFAAMTIAVVDTESGTVRLTHGGDTEQRIYRAGAGEIEEQNLNQAPATGMFSRDIFPPGMEYTEFSLSLAGGDIMILATDGIEESARKIRNDRFEAVPVDEEEAARLADEAKALDPPSSVDVDKNTRIASEEFSTARMTRIIEQLQAQGSFTLKRVRNLDPNEELSFNYLGLEPTARNTVLAIMAAEKVFRLVPDRAIDEPVRVDRELDEFLREHFSAYRRYFSHPVPDEERPDAAEASPREEYVYYTHLREEDQGDDLTILVVRKK